MEYTRISALLSQYEVNRSCNGESSLIWLVPSMVRNDVSMGNCTHQLVVVSYEQEWLLIEKRTPRDKTHRQQAKERRQDSLVTENIQIMVWSWLANFAKLISDR